MADKAGDYMMRHGVKFMIKMVPLKASWPTGSRAMLVCLVCVYMCRWNWYLMEPPGFSMYIIRTLLLGRRSLLKSIL